MQKNAVVEIKYLNFFGAEDTHYMVLWGNGTIAVKTDSVDGDVITCICCDIPTWNTFTGLCQETSGVHAIYFVIEKGRIDFSEFEFKISPR